MQRYEIESFGNWDAEPNDSGMWVDYDDAQAAIAAAVAAERERCAQIVRESWEVHGCCCSDRDALADVIESGA